CIELLTQGKSARFKVNHQYEVEFWNENQVKYGHLMAFVIPSEKGNMIASFIRDITQQKLAELAIKSSEEKLRAIFDNSIQSFIIINHNYEIEAFNEVAKTTTCNFFGKEITVGKSILDFYASHHFPTIKGLIDRL
ncbi:MAG TPA: PAS domain-containing protein, partial [Tenuifilaceae bacterium]|nr:PAS domain-containing protein [Tenuifilaceae bacterium]